MLSEAATVEAVWAVGPDFLEEMLSHEIEEFCLEQVQHCVSIELWSHYSFLLKISVSVLIKIQYEPDDRKCYFG